LPPRHKPSRLPRARLEYRSGSKNDARDQRHEAGKTIPSIL
jgi:hypothetical protein